MSDHSADVGATFRVYWHSTDQSKIFLATDSDEFSGDDAGPGLKIAFSSNGDSRDFHPRYFNRCRRVLIANGKEAPPEAPETSRRI